MHKLTVVILSFTILFQSFSFEVTDFSKMSSLVDHLTKHVDSGDSYTDFISMHYGSEANSHKNEHKEHRELPFKHKHLESHFQYMYKLFSNDILISFKEITYKENKFSYAEPTSISFVNNLLQPPQK